jgi:trehalose 6-phosphate synthase/phosphatase
MCFGDDVSDEFMFNDLPTYTINVKVGKKNTSALYCVDNTTAVRSILNGLIS